MPKASTAPEPEVTPDTPHHPAAVAWRHWQHSEEGLTCRDAATLKAPPASQPYLENRLWRAFMAGRASAGA